MKHFPIKATVKIMIAVVILLIALVLIQSPVLTNDAALAQMEASDGTYVAWSSYAAAVSLVKSSLLGIAGFCLGRAVLEIYKYIKLCKEKSL